VSSPRTFTLSRELCLAIENALAGLDLKFSNAKKIADMILRMSDFYIQNPQAMTPWKEKWCQVAQIAYFFPLNVCRSQAVFQEAKAVNFPMGANMWDYGSGLGAGSWGLVEQKNKGTDLTFIETSSEAQELHQKILRNFQITKSSWNWQRLAPGVGQPDVALFSYSLTELETLPSWAFDTESVIVIEPSTRQDGRRLMQLRETLLAKGFSIWAPCTHQQACPLLTHSKSDWCHDRIHLQMPDWFQEIENHLPMKNQTITCSYLLASKKPAPATEKWRLVGDQLKEKGKTRQLICRGPDHEYLSWLHRHGQPPELHRYDKITQALLPTTTRFEKR